MNEQHALTLIEAHEVMSLLNDAEEVEILRDANPGLLAAYRTLLNDAGMDVDRVAGG